MNTEKVIDFAYEEELIFGKFLPRPGNKEDIILGLHEYVLDPMIVTNNRQIYTFLDLGGDIGGLFESLLFLAAIIMKVFGTNFLDIYII